MADRTHKNLEQRDRLGRIREHMDLRTPIDSLAFEQDVVEACRGRIADMVDGAAVRHGEDVLSHVARHLQVRFEEVREDGDIAALEQKYLHERQEIGFGQLEMELNAPGIDALTFQRMNAHEQAPDRWVAVLNLRDAPARAYWDRSHELIHRIAEPPQRRLQFYRHRNDKANRLESIIDKSAAELAYYPRLFLPIINSVRPEPLTWELVDVIRERFAPTASRLATVHATLRHWPCPAYLLTAQIAGRKGRPHVDRALRIAIRGFTPSAKGEDLFFIHNMRVPPSSPIWHVHQSGQAIAARERLGAWTTSRGGGLPDIPVLTAACRSGDKVLALVSG